MVSAVESLSRRRVVWVTGAAGGIGRAICDAFVETGATVVASDVRACGAPSGVVDVPCDVTSVESIARVAAECDRLGGIDVLVNCAGIMRRADVLDVDPAFWDQVFDVNLKGPFLCSQAAARSMMASGRGGNIIHVGSINAEKVFGDTVAYCSSKGALHALGRSMALNLAQHRIRVNMVGPGAVDDTDLEPERWARREEQEAMLARTPLHRLGKSADVAGTVVFLASDDARHITGATLYVDGGRLATV